MDRDASAPGPLIQGFAGGGFRIDGATYPAVLLTSESATLWSPPPLADLADSDFAALLDAALEFILLGTGAILLRPPAALRAAFAKRSLGLEAMDSRAAARAWGVLRGEGRRIAAALYPLPTEGEAR
ncbi:MAG: Mth938-like domain-containing protein [Pseudomonadota bacterium]